MCRTFFNPISLFTSDLWCSPRINVSSFLDTYLFADDTNCPHTCDGEKSKLINEPNKLFEWIKKNVLSLNISKTQVLQTHGKNDLTIELDGELLLKQPLVTYLGIKIDERFNFTSHIQDIVKKVSKQMFIVWRLRHLVSRDVVIRYYNVYIKPGGLHQKIRCIDIRLHLTQPFTSNLLATKKTTQNNFLQKLKVTFQFTFRRFRNSKHL